MDTWVIILIAVLVILVIVLLVILAKSRKARKENERQAIRKMKDEALKTALSNPFVKMDTVPDNATPIKVKYKTGDKDNTEHMPVIRIDEITKTSEKQFMFGYNERVIIGRQYGTCRILNDSDNGETICMIFYTPNGFGIQLQSNFIVNLIRHRKSTTLSSNVIRLESGDKIMAGDTTFIVKIS